ncbi:MetQ/NlpA family ABC transporter substrate-binding protein [Helicobacter ibis]|uniref:Lipoprotein n=1 Tax=Helicobacter ibis TaxID=2962633 RepID=A0ABT4VHK2_9HELI|nr:MetQ/NlpA family ABC transporter substrate-binding protein [Helicobacter ibis]MDA3969521.1 MetQ/NlpA family ABC transporter substrate-binding protein [Helicobacter ibis]
MLNKLLFSVFGVFLAVFFIACGVDSDSSADTKGSAKLIVGATPEPHATILSQVVPLLEKEGISLEIKEFTDYVTPNLSLEDGSLDANFFQHKPYLDSFNAEKGTKLVSVASIHLEPMGVYSKKIKSLDELKDGDVVTIPNDPSNGSRALRILEKEGIIKLSEGNLVSPQDVIQNDRNLSFKEVDAPQLTRTLDDVTISVINTNFALLANLNPLQDAIAIEDKESPYSNILVVKEGRENDENIQKLVKVLQSDTIKNYINEQYKGAIIPSF